MHTKYAHSFIRCRHDRITNRNPPGMVLEIEFIAVAYIIYVFSIYIHVRLSTYYQ